MNTEQLHRMHEDKGFIAALDQSGGSTPKALLQYGVPENSYSNEDEMYTVVHTMRTRIVTSPSFTSKHILGVILFENTMMRTIEDKPTPDYLWKSKGIVPFLKIDKGLAEQKNGVQLMKPISNLDKLLKTAVQKNVFGTKMRSVINEANPTGVAEIVAQQFTIAKEIINAGLVPIIEPEVNIKSPDKAESEKLLKKEIFKQLSSMREDTKLMFKLSIPDEIDFYHDLMKDPRVVRVVALSGGYSRKEANEKLAKHKGLIASFSRALVEGLSAQQTPEQFDEMLLKSIKGIYEASIT